MPLPLVKYQFFKLKNVIKLDNSFNFFESLILLIILLLFDRIAKNKH